MGDDASSSEETYRQAVCDLVEAVKTNGAEVVPLIGAGASYAAGLPIVAEIVRYLAQHVAYLHHRVYATGEAIPSPQPSLALREHQRQNHARIRAWSWRSVPDLNLALAWATRPKGGSGPHLGTDWMVQQPLDALQRFGHPTATADGPLKLDGSYWPRLTESLVRGDRKLTDELFAMLLRGREPAEFHRYLALLAPVLRIQLFLTTNFDDLLERALRLEGVPHTVYEVARGGGLPTRRLVSTNRSIVKLHGGQHAVLTGEELAHPLDAATQDEIKGYLGPPTKHKPAALSRARRILLVLGFSGNDERIVDLLEIAQKAGWWIVWVNYSTRDAKACLKRLSPDQNTVVEATDVGAFCKAVYRAWKQAHPATRAPLPLFHPVPAPFAVPMGGAGTGGATKLHQESFAESLTTLRAELCEPSLLSAPRKSGTMRLLHLVPCASNGERLSPSLALTRLAGALGGHLRVLWIGLEDKNTIAEILADLQHRMQRVEPTLPPEIVAASFEPPEQLEGRDAASWGPYWDRLALRIFACLARGHFLLVLESADTFGRGALEHHRSPETLDWRMAGFLGALCRLADGGPNELGLVDSVVAVSYTTARSAVDRCAYGTVVLVPALLTSAPDAAQEATLALAVNRRRRSEMLVQHLLGRRGEQLHREPIANQKGLVALEGFDYWMDPMVRDQRYGDWTVAAHGNEKPAVDGQAIKARADAHLKVAQFYRKEVFRSTGDVSTVLEELYHRFAWLKHVPPLDADADEVRHEVEVLATIIEDELFPLRHKVPPIALVRWVEAALQTVGRWSQSRECPPAREAAADDPLVKAEARLRNGLLRLALGAAKDGQIRFNLANGSRASTTGRPATARDETFPSVVRASEADDLPQNLRAEVHLHRRRSAHWAGSGPGDLGNNAPAREVLLRAMYSIPPLGPGRPDSVATFEADCERIKKVLHQLHAEPEEYGVRRSQLESALARAHLHSKRPNFDEAHKLLGRARTGVPAVPATAEARLVAHLRLAECYLLQTRAAASGRVPPDAWRLRLHRSALTASHQSRLHAARDALRVARRLLDERGPMVAHLLEYCRLRAWLGLEKLHVVNAGRVASETREEDRDGYDAWVLKRRDCVRRSLEAVRCGFDLVLQPAETRDQKEIDRRVDPFLHLWDAVRIAHFHPADTDGRSVSVWLDLNARSGLVRLPASLKDKTTAQVKAEKFPLEELLGALCPRRP